MQKPIDSHVRFMLRGYCLEELLGYGKTTSLYRARTEELWQIPEVIMTLVHIPEAFSIQARKRFLERFLHEASKVVQLRYPSLFPLYGYGEEDGLPYLVMPDVTGQTLAERLKKKKRWSPSEALALLEPVAAALSYIHSQGLVYQFFSPANVLFQKDAPPQITGLNLSQILCLAGLEEEKINTSSFDHLKNIAGGYLGAPEYLAPEVMRGGEPDPRSDVYSLGVILFEMLSGQPPFTGKDYLEVAHKHIQTLLPSLHGITPELPAALELVINRALHRNLNYRFQTPSELITTFSHVVEERIYRVKHVSLLTEGEQIRALLTSPTSKVLQDDSQFDTDLQTASTTHSQENLSEKKRPISNDRIIPPTVTLPSSSLKKNRLADDPIGPGLKKKPPRSVRGFLTSESKTDPRPPLSSPTKGTQRSDKRPNMDEKSAVPANNTDIAAMAQELHLMMRKLQASLSK